MGLPKDSQHASSCDIKKGNDNNAEVTATVTPTRESRSNEQRHKNDQSEEAKGIACIEQNDIFNLKSLCESF